jgi:hypothetical protein
MTKLNLNIFYVFFGWLIFCYLFYFRVIYKRVPRELYTNISTFLLILYILIILGHLISLIMSIYKIFFYKNKTTKKTFKEKLMENKYIISISSLFDIYSKSLKEFDNYIKSFPVIDKYYTEIMFNFSCFITENFKFYYGVYFNFLFNFFIRIILILAFSIDVLYFHKFYYFFKVLPLIIILLIYEYILHCISEVTKTNLNTQIKNFTIIVKKDNSNNEINLNEYLILKSRECTSNPLKGHEFYTEEYLINTNFSNYHFSFSEEFIKELDLENSSLDEQKELLINVYIHIHKAIIYPALFYEMLHVFKTDIHGPKITLFTSTLYLISWSYILLYGIGYI